jgi:hypothetical protein
VATLKQLEYRIAALEERNSNPGRSRAAEVTLEKHLETRLSELREYMISQIASLKEAAAIAAHQQEIKFITQNEWRGSLTDLSARMATRSDLDNQIGKVRSEMALQFDRVMSDKEKTDAEVA